MVSCVCLSMGGFFDTRHSFESILGMVVSRSFCGHGRRPLAGETHIESLDFASQSTDDMFGRGSVDRFTFDVTDVGEPFKLQVAQNKKGLWSDWRCDKIVMIDVKDKLRYEFPVDAWLKDKSPFAEAVVGSKKGLDEKRQSKTVKAAVAAEEVAETTYRVYVTTGDDKYAGTDSNITLTLTGNLGVSRPTKLEKSLTNKNKFERGKTDEFVLGPMAALGDIKAIKLRSDFARGMKIGLIGDGHEWQVAEVKVKDENTGTEYIFDCKNMWLSKKYGAEKEIKKKR